MRMLPRLLITISLARQPWKVPNINLLMNMSSMTRSAAPPSPLRLPAGKRSSGLFRIILKLVSRKWLLILLTMIFFPPQLKSVNCVALNHMKSMQTLCKELPTGMLWQPSFAFTDIVWWMRLLVGHWFVTFTYSNSSCSILEKKNENYTSLYNFLESVKHTHLGREVSLVFPFTDTGKIWGISWSAPWHTHTSCDHITMMQLKYLPCNTLRWHGGFCLQRSRLINQTWIGNSGNKWWLFKPLHCSVDDDVCH